MYCTKALTPDLSWVGGNDRRLALFEGIYPVPTGVSYNSYLLMDEKTVLFDTVDKAVSHIFFENITHVLGDRTLDYLVIHHMEPDHSATMEEVLLRYPDVTIVCNAKIASMIGQFYSCNINEHLLVIQEGSVLSTGKHNLTFVMAPLVHWPEVMVTYDTVDKILFSADAFGTFGALNGAIFTDEVDFAKDYMDDFRRYYTNIVGKYGKQVQALFNKTADLEINMICPLHGFVARKPKNIKEYVEKYQKWSTYTPEDKGVMIAYASVYGNTANAAEIVSSRLRDRGIKTVMYDVSVTHPSEIIAKSFQYSHLFFASLTYNSGIFVAMDALLRDIAAHNLQNRTVAFLENGSWGIQSARLMKAILEPLSNMTFVENTVSVKSSLKPHQEKDLDALVDAIAASVTKRKRS